MTNWYYFFQSSFTLHSLPFELSSISLSLECLLYHLFLRQSSITVHVRRSTHLLFMISWCAFHSPEGFARRVPFSSIRCNKEVGKSQVEVCERRGKSFIKYFKVPFIKKKKHTLWIYHLHVNLVKGYTKMARRPPFLPIYSHKAYIWKEYNFSTEYTRKEYLFSKIVYIRVRDWTSGRNHSEQCFIE